MQLAVALALSSGLAYHGLRKRSLTGGGAVAAFCVGFGMQHACVRAGGVLLVPRVPACERMASIDGSHLPALAGDWWWQCE